MRSVIDRLAYNDYYQIVDQKMSDSNVGGRVNRSIVDNLFVIYAIQNEALRKNISVDVLLMDLSKCFDKMWSQETMNDLFDLGVQNDRFVLVSKMNEECIVTVKTPVGVTDTFTLENIEMQGTVPAPLKCAGQMDALGRKCYAEEDYLYKYNGNCSVPNLGFIDDTIAATKCGIQSVEVNALINTFIESKKLYFNTSKCCIIHLGPRKEECCPLLVHKTKMKQCDYEKYLGDILSNTGNDRNIENRRKIGHQTISTLLSTLKEVGVGGHYIATGLVYRDSILKSKLLLNSDVWHSLTQQQVSVLEQVDRKYLRCILKSHSKVAIECIYFEAGVMPLKYDIMQKRMMYLWKILHLDEEEVISRVYRSQSNSSHVGDWVRLVAKSKEDLDLEYSDEDIKTLSKNKFARIVQEKVKKFALFEMNELKNKHEKSKYLKSSKFETSDYLKDERFTKEECQLLFKLRSQTLNIKVNFPKQHDDIWCQVCKLFPESQAHLLNCPEIVLELNLVSDVNEKLDEKMIYGDTHDKLKIVKIYKQIMETRKTMLEQMNLK